MKKQEKEITNGQKKTPRARVATDEEMLNFINLAGKENLKKTTAIVDNILIPLKKMNTMISNMDSYEAKQKSVKSFESVARHIEKTKSITYKGAVKIKKLKGF